MLRRLTLVVLTSLLVAACGSASGTPSPVGAPAAAATAAAAATSAAVTTGRAFIEALARGDDAGAEAMTDAGMRAAAPAARLGQIWQAFVAQYGAFQGIAGVTTTEQPPYVIAGVVTVFARQTVILDVTVDAAGQVGGLHVGAAVATAPAASSPGGSPAGGPGQAGQSAPPASPAAYVHPGSFTETSVTVGSAPWALPGTLTMPVGAGPFPAVVLVAGSGPEDRDESIGPNKPFRDLAWGLASAGIAVLRYDKRTLVHAAQMAAQESTITVRQETTDDALAAVALLRGTPKVDPARVFLLGHSLGGYLAPRIAAAAPGQLRGLIMLEANSTPLAQLILAQARYLASLQASLASPRASPGPQASPASPPASPDTQVEQQLATLAQEVAVADSPSLSASTPASQLPLGVPASYWLDLRTYDPLATAAGLRLPMFFSQGGRDYQVPPGELRPWERALAGRSDVTFRTYPAMDHLLLDGSGPATPTEYTVPGHVDAQLVADLAGWITSH